jgi:hypothetical protein
LFASDLVRKAVSTSPRSDMDQRVEALSRVVESMRSQPASQEMTYPNAKHVASASLMGCELPPIEKTLEVLKFCKGDNTCLHLQTSPVSIQLNSHSLVNASAHEWIMWALGLFRFTPENLSTICLTAYVNDEYDAAKFITVNFSLYYLFAVCGFFVEEKRDEYLELCRLCATNLETALSALPLHLPATDQVILALAVGVRKTILLATRCSDLLG